MKIFKNFGKFPDANRLKYFKTTPNYKKGKFQNLENTPSLTKGYTLPQVLIDWLRKYPDTYPSVELPHIYTDLQQISIEENVLVWFGHSSYYFQIDGKRFLVDPVFSGNVSPIPNTIKAFLGTNDYQAKDIPKIDYLIISHDHWDHLDYETVQQLQGKVGKVICGLGVAQHFEYWGWDNSLIEEHNWNETITLAENFRLTYTPAGHFSGRGLKRNISLWTSFVLQSPSFRIFLGGDSGYGKHFKAIGENYGPFDLAILECGQYDKKWAYIHSQPEETLQEILDLKAKSLLPVHHSKFKLAQHPWYEPLERISALAAMKSIPLLTPPIGEKVDLNHLNKSYSQWWKVAMKKG